MIGWELPRSVELQGRRYEFCWDYRDILEIFSYFEDPDLPEFLRWQIVLGLFYKDEIPVECQQAAMEYLCFFIRGGQPEEKGPARKMIDWEMDAPLIVADINKVAGVEIRGLPALHWWTFLSYFFAIGEGQLSTVLSIREKRFRGKPLEKWEREFYQAHKGRIDLKKRYSQQEIEQRARLEELLKTSEK